MSKHRIIGIGVIIVAGVIAFMGYSESQGFASSISSSINGNVSESILLKYIVAGVLTVSGLILVKR